MVRKLRDQEARLGDERTEHARERSAEPELLERVDRVHELARVHHAGRHVVRELREALRRRVRALESRRDRVRRRALGPSSHDQLARRLPALVRVEREHLGGDEDLHAGRGRLPVESLSGRDAVVAQAGLEDQTGELVHDLGAGVAGQSQHVLAGDRHQRARADVEPQRVGVGRAVSRDRLVQRRAPRGPERRDPGPESGPVDVRAAGLDRRQHLGHDRGGRGTGARARRGGRGGRGRRRRLRGPVAPEPEAAGHSRDPEAGERQRDPRASPAPSSGLDRGALAAVQEGLEVHGQLADGARPERSGRRRARSRGSRREPWASRQGRSRPGADFPGSRGSARPASDPAKASAPVTSSWSTAPRAKTSARAVTASPVELLGRHVGKRPERRPALGQAAGAQVARRAEVGEPGVARFVEEDVLRLEVAVDEPRRVAALEVLREVADESDASRQGSLPCVLEPSAERAAREKSPWRTRADRARRPTRGRARRPCPRSARAPRPRAGTGRPPRGRAGPSRTLSARTAPVARWRAR